MDTNITKEQRQIDADNEFDNQSNDSEKLFLLDDNLFIKYQFLFENKKNFEYLKRVKTNSLIYSKRYYPITKKELEMIKKNIVENQQINNAINQKLIEDVNPTEKNQEFSGDDNLTKLENKEIKDQQDSIDTESEVTFPAAGESNFKSEPSSDLPTPDLAQKSVNFVEKHLKPKKIIWKPLTWTSFKSREKTDGK